MSDQSTLLLEHHLKELKLPTVLREYGKLAAQCAAEGVSHPDYLLRLAELELTDRHQRMVQRRIRAARFPATKGLDTFDFSAIPSVNQPLVMQLARCEYVEHHENVIAIGNSGTGKTHVALGLGLAACQRGLSVGFTTAAALVNELMEARDERRLLNLQRQLARLRLLIIDELGFVPLSHTGAELLFEVFSQRYERGSILVTTNLPFDEWTPGLRVGTAHRRAAGPPYPPRAHPGDERRQLPPQGQPPGGCGGGGVAGPVSSRLAPRRCQNRIAVSAGAPPRQARPRPSGTAPVVRLYAAQVVRFSAALDNFSLENHYPRCTGALSYPFNTPPHSSFRWIGGKGRSGIVKEGV